MNSDSNPVSNFLKTEAITEDEKTSGTDDIAGSVPGGSQVTNSEDVTNTFAHVFTEDILPDIFDNLLILTAKDLLQFRLVNRCWRDAATSVLLKRNLCRIPLSCGKIKKVRSGLDARPLENSRLSNLSEIISTSPKFPSTSFVINYLICGPCSKERWSIPDSADAGVAEFCEDLLLFLSLHGKKIRKLSLVNGISKKALQNLLYVHTPHLISLDIPDFDFQYENEYHEASQRGMPVCLPPPSTLQLKQIFVGGRGPPYVCDEVRFNFVKELIECSPNLIAIQDIATSSLEDLLEMEKCHLVKGAWFGLLHLTPRFKKLVTDTILKGSLPNVPTFQLSKLTVVFIEYWGVNNTNDVMINGLNLILSASKTSLKHLKFDMPGTDHLVNIFVPPLPHLTFLQLSCFKTSPTIRFHFLGDVLGHALQAGQLTADGPVDDLSELIRRNQGNNNINIPADYFSRLREVNVFPRSPMFTQGGKFVEFFSVEHLEADGVTTVPGDTLPIVTSLELGQFPRDGGNMSQLFPNVSHLKITLLSLECVLNQNWVWSVFPQLQRFELVCVMVPESGWSMADVDSFFTGFSKEICAKIETSVTATESELDVGPGAVFERTQPYIGDSKNLKEFKFTFFYKLCYKFASKITAIHGFQHVIHQTKIIFSFVGRPQNVKEMEETRLNLEPVAGYVDIRMRE